ncbi:MAG: FtsX-like permease family protein [Sphaerochaetaceae bacterium]|nr:FtsX-like permease family protein [Sphaerochaetaceae bacterium]MDC7250651.1 FtsX-like permease family protein [Sphaerochaetaceae bacterium]
MFKLAWKNILRNKRRSILSASAIFLAVVFVSAMLSLYQGMIMDMQENIINHQLGNINIKTKLYVENERILPLQFYIKNVDEKIEDINSIPGVEFATAVTKIPAMTFLGDESYNVSIYGVDFENSRFFDAGILNAGDFPSLENQVLISSKLAQEMNIGVNDSFTFLSKTAIGGSNALGVTVSGIYSSNDMDMNNLNFYISNDKLSTTLRMVNGATEILVYTDNQLQKSVVEDKLNDSTLYVADWKDDSLIGQMIDLVKVIYGIIQVIFLLFASTIILNTTMMSIIERKREIATLVALGYNPHWIRRLFLFETALLTFIASVFGAIVGAIFISILNKTGLDMIAMGGGSVSGYSMSSYIYPFLPFENFVYLILIAIAISTLTCFFPTKRVLKIEPAKALHDET